MCLTAVSFNWNTSAASDGYSQFLGAQARSLVECPQFWFVRQLMASGGAFWQLCHRSEMGIILGTHIDTRVLAGSTPRLH